MAELLLDILRRCQETLRELSIDTSLDMHSEMLLVDRLSALTRDSGTRDSRLRLEGLRALHLKHYRSNLEDLEIALFPACPNIDTLCVGGILAESLAVDREMYSSVKYLCIEDYVDLTPQHIEAIVGRFANLESLMFESPTDHHSSDVMKDVCNILKKYCPSLKQLGMSCLSWPSGRYADLRLPTRLFTAMPQLVLIQDPRRAYNTVRGSRHCMARRCERAAGDEVGSLVYEFGFIDSRLALERFQARPAVLGRPEGWDVLHEEVVLRYEIKGEQLTKIYRP